VSDEKLWDETPTSRQISTSSANAFNTRKAAIFPLSIRWISNLILISNATMFSDTSKNVLSAFPCTELLSWHRRPQVGAKRAFAPLEIGTKQKLLENLKSRV